MRLDNLVGPDAFDTGGYTGDWNSSEGRMAVLHEKEIVLNKEDTQNILTAVDIVRRIANSLNTSMYNDTLRNIESTFRHEIDAINNDMTIEQNVHITAEFPNATDHSEIEEAFRNLTNLASQYANRKS
jgi:hypothetical protein